MTVYSDDFNRSDGGLGASWLNFSGGGFSGTLAISSNQVTTSAGNVSGGAAYSASVGSDQVSQITYVSGISSSAMNLAVRMGSYTSGTANGYYGQVNGFGNTWKISRVDAGTETDLTASTALTITNADVFRLEVAGTTITLKQNGITLGSVVDSTYSGGDVAFTAYSFTPSLLLDSWTGGDLASSPPQWFQFQPRHNVHLRR